MYYNYSYKLLIIIIDNGYCQLLRIFLVTPNGFPVLIPSDFLDFFWLPWTPANSFTSILLFCIPWVFPSVCTIFPSCCWPLKYKLAQVLTQQFLSMWKKGVGMCGSLVEPDLVSSPSCYALRAKWQSGQLHVISWFCWCQLSCDYAISF